MEWCIAFSGGVKEANKVIQYGLILGINGIATFANSRELQEALPQVPRSALIVETDCPFLSPVPYRGKTNEPARLVEIVQCIADLRGETPEAVAEYTTANARQLFSL